jgi:RNA polymerase sigma factor (sigma-70 family)
MGGLTKTIGDMSKFIFTILSILFIAMNPCFADRYNCNASLHANGLGPYADEAARFPKLTNAEQVELARKAKNGDLGAKKELAQSCLLFVISLALEYSKNFNLPVDDLVQEGNIGLMQAIERYNPKLNDNFISYAALRIRGNIFEEVERVIRFSKRGLVGAVRGRLLDIIQDEKSAQSFEHIDNYISLRVRLEKFKKTLDAREQAVFDHRFMSDDMTAKAIGEMFGVTKQRILKVEQSLAERIRRVLLFGGYVDRFDIP